MSGSIVEDCVLWCLFAYAFTWKSFEQFVLLSGFVPFLFGFVALVYYVFVFPLCLDRLS